MPNPTMSDGYRNDELGWFVFQDGKAIGPFSMKQLATKAREGEIGLHDLVQNSRGLCKRWTRACAYTFLQIEFAKKTTPAQNAQRATCSQKESTPIFLRAAFEMFDLDDCVGQPGETSNLAIALGKPVSARSDSVEIRLLMHVIANHLMNVHSFQDNPTILENIFGHDVVAGFRQFASCSTIVLGHCAISKSELRDGFANWFHRRQTGHLAKLTQEQQAADHFAENWIREKWVTQKADRLREMFQKLGITVDAADFDPAKVQGADVPPKLAPVALSQPKPADSNNAPVIQAAATRVIGTVPQTTTGGPMPRQDGMLVGLAIVVLLFVAIIAANRASNPTRGTQAKTHRTQSVDIVVPVAPTPPLPQYGVTNPPNPRIATPHGAVGTSSNLPQYASGFQPISSYAPPAPLSSYSLSSQFTGAAHPTSSFANPALNRYYDPTYRPSAGDHFVQPYVRRDGTFVSGHYRTNADSSFWNNYSSKGNLNPHTGKVGTRMPSFR